LAISFQIDEYKNEIKNGNVSMQEALDILENVKNKYYKSNHKDKWQEDDGRSTVGMSLAESQGLYIALYFFSVANKSLLFAPEIPKDEKIDLM
jgi:hypothetical protein